MTSGPLESYRALLSRGDLVPDPSQALAAEKLQSLHNALKGYDPAQPENWKARLGLARRKVEPPQGLYFYGHVGSGKSMLMDLFFATAPIEKKRRVHFHAFMGEVQDRLHGMRNSGETGPDPLDRLANELFFETWLLCFDEFHVVNIADAMVLGRLFSRLFDLGLVVVATSNWAPDHLYEGGLQRDRFLPFIAVLKDRLDIMELGQGRDYRLEGIKKVEAFHAPLGPGAQTALEKIFDKLTQGAVVGPQSVENLGRTIIVPRAARGVGFVDFDALCNSALGARDYLVLAAQFHTLILSGVPQLDETTRNQARRFMSLIDALYEKSCRLFMSAQTPPEKIYSGKDGAQEFLRTVSRLQEMRSEKWIEGAPKKR